MQQIPTEANLVADALMRAETADERRKIATGLLAYSLGALAALDGPQSASEAAYRHADALVTLR